MTNLKVLFLSDTHLGIDTPAREKIRRRRRGPDFFANYHEALKPAFRGEVDLVVHGGDMFYRSQIPAGLVARAFEPLKRLASRGIPVFIVPGNHERSAIPFPLLTLHPGIHIFDEPRTFNMELKGVRVAISGFPFVRKNIRSNFPEVVAQTGWDKEPADVRLLCMHHSVEGALVGSGFRFGKAHDVVRCQDIPEEFAACLSGHIHRFQIIDEDPMGNAMPTPVIYPGSIERTSFMERDENKGFLTLKLCATAQGGSLTQWQFHELATRPMIQRDLSVFGCNELALKTRIWQTLADIPQDSVVLLRILGPLDDRRREACWTVRRLAPPTMNLELSFAS